MCHLEIDIKMMSGFLLEISSCRVLQLGKFNLVSGE